MECRYTLRFYKFPQPKALSSWNCVAVPSKVFQAETLNSIKWVELLHKLTEDGKSAQRWRTLIRCDSTESNSLFASTQSECLMKFSSISISFLILASFTSLLVPPNIDDSLSSSDVIVREGSNITLKCRAHGSPQPTIKWKRDDSSKININKSLSGMLMSRPSSPFPRRHSSISGEF